MSNLNAKETIIKIHYRQVSKVLQFGSGKHWRICSIIGAFEISLCLFHPLIWLSLSLPAQVKIYSQITAMIKSWWGLPVYGRLLPEIIQSSTVKKKISAYCSTTSRDKHNFKINILIYFSLMFHFLFAEELRKPTTSCTSIKMPSNTFQASDICKIFCCLQVLESLWITHLCICPVGAGHFGW